MKKWMVSVLVVFIVGSLFIPFFVEKLFFFSEISDYGITKSFTNSEILNFAGNFVTVIATALLGIIVLYQNDLFKKENEKSQESLNNAVTKLAEANEIIATTNEKLFLLEKSNQNIQLLLAQDFIPSLPRRQLERDMATIRSAHWNNTPERCVGL